MPIEQHRLFYGAHMSIAGGIEKAIERGESIGCTALQIFTKSNRQWHANPITRQEAALFQKTWTDSSVLSIIAHASYLINIGSNNPAISKKSITAVVDELERCHVLTIPYLVLHPGSYTTTSEQDCLDRIVNSLDAIFDAMAQGPIILLETMAGQGSSVCYTFEQLAYIHKNVKHKQRIGICFDTCHVFCAGYDFSTPKKYKAMWHEFDRIIGLENLKAMHINDSKKECGSRIDRHEDIGKGKIGLTTFKLLFNDPRFFDIPKILETPKESLQDDARNMAVIQELLTQKTEELLEV